MYVILDKNLERVGSLSVHGGTPFWGDSVTQQIADQDSDISLSDAPQNFNTADPHANTKSWNHTLDSISIPYGYPYSDKIVQGTHLAYKDSTNNRWYVMRLTDISDEIDSTGTHFKSCVGVNLAIWDMVHTELRDWTLENATCKQAFDELLVNTGWAPGELDYTGGTQNITFSKMDNAQSQIQTLCQKFDCEIDAYVEFNTAGQIVNKNIDIKDKLGVNDGRTIRYGSTLISMKRTSTDVNLITRIYPYNSDGTGIASVNGGKPYVEDTKANDLYSSGALNIDGAKFLEGAVEGDNIRNPSALKAWATNLLKKFNHPRINYEVTISPNFKAGLGDTIKVIDLKMLPEAGVVSRVIQKKISQADPKSNQVILGEFVTVKITTPEIISKLQKRLDNAVRKAVQDVKSGLKAATVKLVTPLGANWTSMESSKIVIAKVTVNSVNITSYLSQSAFKWFKNDPVTGFHDLDWEKRHANDGYQIELDEDDIGTITCRIEGDYLKSSPELFTDPANHYTQLFEDTLRAGNDSFGDSLNQYYQYSWLDQDSSTFIMSQAYTASLVDKEPKDNHTKYHRFVNGVYKDTMILQDGNHGSSFGCRMVNGIPEIWTNHSPGSGFELIKVPYQPNKIVFNEDSSITHLCKVPKFFRMSTDFVHGYVLGIAASNGEIDVVKMEDVEKGNWNPVYRRNVSDYDMTQLPGNDFLKQYHTLQSNDINFPYVIFNAGNNNNFDDRIVCCINIVTGAEVFRNVVFSSDISSTIVDPTTSPEKVPFEPEAIGFYNDHGQDFLLEGYGYHRIDSDGVERSKRGIWRINLNHRDDSKDKITYQNVNDDNVGGGEIL